MKTFIAILALAAVAVAAPAGPLVQLIVNINADDVPAGAAIGDIVDVVHETPSITPIFAEVPVDNAPVAILPVMPVVETPDTVAIVPVMPVVETPDTIIVPVMPVVETPDTIIVPVMPVVEEVPESIVNIPVVGGIGIIDLPAPVELPAAVLPVVVQPEIAVNLPEILN